VAPFREIHEDGVERGLFRPLPESIYTSFFTGAVSDLVQAHLNGGPELDDEIIDRTFEMIWGAHTADAPSSDDGSPALSDLIRPKYAFATSPHATGGGHPCDRSFFNVLPLHDPPVFVLVSIGRCLGKPSVAVGRRVRLDARPGTVLPGHRQAPYSDRRRGA
jgi:hypothetical protein